MTSNEIAEALNTLAQGVYDNAASHGWHDQKEDRSDVENYAIWLININGEAAELWESARLGTLTQPCDKADKMEAVFGQSLTCEEEELADIIIRAIDTAAARGLDIGRAVLLKHAYNKTRAHKHGGKLA